MSFKSSPSTPCSHTLVILILMNILSRWFTSTWHHRRTHCLENWHNNEMVKWTRPVKRKFSGFKSRCSIPLWWQCRVARNICSIRLATFEVTGIEQGAVAAALELFWNDIWFVCLEWMSTEVCMGPMHDISWNDQARNGVHLAAASDTPWKQPCHTDCWGLPADVTHFCLVHNELSNPWPKSDLDFRQSWLLWNDPFTKLLPWRWLF